MTRAEHRPGILPPDPRKIRILHRATAIDHEWAVASSPWTAFRRQFLRYYAYVPPLWRVGVRALFSQERMVPDFASLGAPRSGTTLLADYLMQHPCVVLPLAKEIQPAPTLKLVLSQFPTLREKRKAERKYGTAITGYCSPVMPSLLVPYAMSALTAKMKFVLLLRNPVDRTFAHWRYVQSTTARFRLDPLWKNLPDFGEVVRVELDAVRQGAASGFNAAPCGGFIQNSIYLPFLKLLFRFYDKHDAIFINSDDFFSAPAAVAKRIYRFLGLPDYEPVELPVRNAGPPGQMDAETRQLLADFFAPLNQELYEYIGQDFAWQ